ncbi:hypothetical protein BGZ76_009398, partial [Entomortierella beljakovae]
MAGQPPSNGGSLSSVSVMSVPIMDPYFRDFKALQTDHNTLLDKLKQMQQMLQGSYQELSMTQQRSKRAEADSGRLRAQMDIILKKHTDHHPERESLVQQLLELQSQLQSEIGSRKDLEREYAILDKEFTKFKLDNPTISASASISPPSNSNSNSNSSNGSAQNNSPSPLASPISIISLPFSSFLRGGRKSQKASISDENIRVSSSASVKSLRFTENEDGSNHRDFLQEPTTPLQPSSSSSNKSHEQQLQQEQEECPKPTIEECNALKQFCDKLQEDNVAMKLELVDLKHRYNSEKDSIKSYMSLFESLQKKQSNALAISQSEIELLRSNLQEQYLCLNAREGLIHSLVATIASQSVDLEILTNQSCRDQAALAKVEQELSLLFEASLTMLERWFGNLQLVREKLGNFIIPLDETIRKNSNNNNLENNQHDDDQHDYQIKVLLEWEKFETGLKDLMDGLAKSLMKQQIAQDKELETGVVSSQYYYSTKAYYQQERKQRKRTSSSFSNSSISAVFNNNSSSSSSSNKEGIANIAPLDDANQSDNSVKDISSMAFDNTKSQEVFVWRKFTADSFLENCVMSVENLAQERRKLQMRLVELTQLLSENDQSGQQVGGGAGGGVECKDKSNGLTLATANETTIIEVVEPKRVDIQDNSTSTEEEIQESTKIEKQDIGVDAMDQTVSDSEKRAQHLEAILNAMMKFKEDCQNSKQGLSNTHRNLEDEVLSLGISEGSSQGECFAQQQQQLSQSQPLTVMRADLNLTRDSTLPLQDIESMFEWIQKELTHSSEKSLRVNVKEHEIVENHSKDQVVEESTTDQPPLPLPNTLEFEQVDIPSAPPADGTVTDQGIEIAQTTQQSPSPLQKKIFEYEIAEEVEVKEARSQKESDIPLSQPTFPIHTEIIEHEMEMEMEMKKKKDVVEVVVEETSSYLMPPVAEEKFQTFSEFAPITTLPSSSSSSTTTAEAVAQEIKDEGISNNGASSNIIKPKPKNIRPVVAIPTRSLSEEFINNSSSSSSSASPSSNSSFINTALLSASSCSSTTSSYSNYFSQRVNIAGLAAPRISPGLGGVGPDGKASILDMNAFCQDLAFRSFPKQHQWSKSRGAGASTGVGVGVGVGVGIGIGGIGGSSTPRDTLGVASASSLLQSW